MEKVTGSLSCAFGQPKQFHDNDGSSDSNKSAANTAFSSVKFPFICGICGEKFNIINSFYVHISSHKQTRDFLHSCKLLDEKQRISVYTCGICNLQFPSLCILYDHLRVIEGVGDFVYRSKERTVYAIKCESEDKKSDVDASPNEQQFDIKTIQSLDSHSENINDETHVMLKKDLSEMNFNHGEKTEKIFTTGRKRSELSSNKLVRNAKRKRTAMGRQNKIIKTRQGVKTSKLPKQKESKNILTVDSLKDDNIRVSNENESYSDSTISYDSDADKLMKVAAYSQINNINNEKEDHMQSYKRLQHHGKGKTRTSKGSRGDMLYPCEICGAICKHRNMQKHKSTHEARTLKCAHCDNMYSCKFKLATHEKQVHVDENKFTCDECGKMFKAWPYLRQHRQVHLKDRNLQCPMCTQTFRYKATLRAHLRIHSEEKPYKCDQCGSAFRRTYDLTSHMQYHSDKKDHQCPKCQKAFKTKADMRKHYRIHLPPKHICHVCNKPFVTKCNMRTHMKVHGIIC